MTSYDLLTKRVSELYRLRSAKSLGDPRLLLAKFEIEVQKNLLPEDEVAFARKVFLANPDIQWGHERKAPWPDGYEKARDTARSAGVRVKYKAIDVIVAGRELFLALLQQYSLPSTIRKKIEATSKVYSKAYSPRSAKTTNLSEMYLKEVENYEKFFPVALKHLEAAKEAISKGVLHSEEGGETESAPTKVKVGGFTVVNTGGFPEKTITEICDLTQKVQALLNSSGFGKVCYGDVLITNSLADSRTLAFYQVKSDELFIRAEAKGGSLLQTILHELGHRYRWQILPSSGSAEKLRALYRKMEGDESSNLFDKLKTLRPEKGDTANYKGATLVVEDVSLGFRGETYYVRCKVQGDEKASLKMPLESWLGLKGVKRRDPDDPELRGFITEYAKRGGPEENFAEMFSYYCLGKLRAEYKEAFEALVFGNLKTAHDWSAHRVAVRWILEG